MCQASGSQADNSVRLMASEMCAWLRPNVSFIGLSMKCVWVCDCVFFVTHVYYLVMCRTDHASIQTVLLMVGIPHRL